MERRRRQNACSTRQGDSMLYEFRVIGLTIAVLTICGDGQARQSDITKRDERQAVIVTTPEIAAVYKALVSLDEHERNALFRSLSSEAKAALWKTQIGRASCRERV